MKRSILILLILALLLPVGSAVAKKKGKKAPKPWTSEEGTIAVAHPVFYTTAGEIVSLTMQELQNGCTMPASQGFDAFIVEVPAEYQKIEATATAAGSSTGAGGYDLDVFFFDSNCEVFAASQNSGTDEVAFMPAGTSWIGVGNYLADPNVSVQVELKP
jgi:extracellular elastinolytic metalloproteinase